MYVRLTGLGSVRLPATPACLRASHRPKQARGIQGNTTKHNDARLPRIIGALEINPLSNCPNLISSPSTQPYSAGGAQDSEAGHRPRAAMTWPSDKTASSLKCFRIDYRIHTPPSRYAFHSLFHLHKLPSHTVAAECYSAWHFMV